MRNLTKSAWTNLIHSSCVGNLAPLKKSLVRKESEWTLCCPPHRAFTFSLGRCLALHVLFSVWVLSDFSVLMARALILLCSHIMECFLWNSIHKGITAPMHLCSFTAFWLVLAVTEVPIWFSPFYHLTHHHILLMYFLRILAVTGSCCFPDDMQFTLES